MLFRRILHLLNISSVIHCGTDVGCLSSQQVRFRNMLWTQYTHAHRGNMEWKNLNTHRGENGELNCMLKSPIQL